MSSLLLGVLWVVVVVGVLIPVSSAAAMLLLSLRRRLFGHAAGADSAFLLIVLPTLAPIIWFVSETVHASEHYLVGQTQALCYDLLIASALLMALVAASVATQMLAEHRRSGELDSDATSRLHALCEAHPGLAKWAGRIVAMRNVEHDSATRGVFSPRVELCATFAERLHDAALTAVLLHEVEHLRKFDPLRNLLGHLSLRINPLGRWLLPEWQRWRAERELRCDAAALKANADPLSLAEAILVAARPRRTPVIAALLGGAQPGFINLRIQRLLEPVTEPVESIVVSILPLALLVSELVLPHLLSSAPIQQIHNIALHPLLAAFAG